MTTMRWYYQIKGKQVDGDYAASNWIWPPIFTGVISSENRESAKKDICELYGNKFPTRVLKKDLDSANFLLHLEEVIDGVNSCHIDSLIDIRQCKNCQRPFRIIDKYNDSNNEDKGGEFCCIECRKEYNIASKCENTESGYAYCGGFPTIYKITNKNTLMCYIGQTSQIFTLRWYQHFFQGSSNKFHTAIKESKLSDWIFEIIEVVDIPDGIVKLEEKKSFITEREDYYIRYYNSINHGYNTVRAIAESDVNDERQANLW